MEKKNIKREDSRIQLKRRQKGKKNNAILKVERVQKVNKRKKKTKNEFADRRQPLAVLLGMRPAQLLGRWGRVGRQDPISLGCDKVLDGFVDILHVRPDQHEQQRGRDRGDEGDGGMSREEPEAATEDVYGKAGCSQVKLACWSGSFFKALEGRGQGFCDDSTKAFVRKKCDNGGR